jgi:AICAR transformylase/IMP cyclohydrolase PurH
MRVVAAISRAGCEDGRDVRSILGAFLVQARDRVAEASAPWPTADLRVVTKRQPTAESGRRCASRGGSART